MFGALAGFIGSAASAVGSWLGGAAGAVTSLVKGAMSSGIVKKAIDWGSKAISSFLKGKKEVKRAHFTKKAPAPKAPTRSASAPAVRSEGFDKSDKKDKTLLYVAIGAVALIAIVFLMKK